MECIEASFNSDEFELKLDKFMHDEMDESEHEEFCIHMMQCEYCHEQVRAQQKLRRVLKLEFTYEELCDAYEKREWQKVLDLAGKMKAQEYLEEVYPINEKVDAAESELKVKDYYDKETDKTIEMISLIIDGKRTEVELGRDDLVQSLPTEGNFKIEFAGNVVCDIDLQSEFKREGVASPFAYHSKDKKEITLNVKNLTIKIVEGKFENKLIIKTGEDD